MTAPAHSRIEDRVLQLDKAALVSTTHKDSKNIVRINSIEDTVQMDKAAS